MAGDNSLREKATSCAWIGLGSNLGNSVHILQSAWQRLGREHEISLQRLSTFYRSRPVDMESAHWFINGVGNVRTSLSPGALLEVLLCVENEFGRRRDPDAVGHQDRTLDLDLLLYDDRIVDEPRLQLPHPRMQNRMFVLAPFVELAPELIHPRLRLSMATLKEKLLAEPKAAAIHQVFPLSGVDGV